MTAGESNASAPARRILVVNGKGGCGKTTVATNLAVAYAAAGLRVTLVDCDAQGSSAHWATQREADAAKVSVLRAFECGGASGPLQELAPPNTERLIVDGHAAGNERELQQLIDQADVILVPILPSSIDIRVGSRFITQVITHRRFRAMPRALGVLANRVQPNADTHVKLRHFLGCLGQPVAATFRDSPVYSDAIEAGQGVIDMLDSRAARKETPAWRQLSAWVDAQPLAAGGAEGYVRRRPVAAGRRSRRETALSA